MYSNLKRLFVLALSAIGFFVLISHVMYMRHLEQYTYDSSILNNAGRQRMLSQELAKEALQLTRATTTREYHHIAEEIQNTLVDWTSFHLDLMDVAAVYDEPGESKGEFDLLLEEINPYFPRIREAADSILWVIENGSPVLAEILEPQIKIILDNETSFLQGMEKVVNYIDQSAARQVKRLERFEYIVTALILILILLELIFVFIPAANHIKKVIGQLVDAEKKSKQMALNADNLSREKEKSVRELKVLNQAINQKLFFARVRPDGEIVQLGERFSRTFDIRNGPGQDKIQHILSTEVHEQHLFERLLHQYARSNWQGEVQGTSQNGAEVWLEMTMIPYHMEDSNWEILIIASDITSRKEAQREIEQLTKEKFENEMNRQKLISSKIIENQEQEQNRIAKDIHDGIGQMLTALSLNLENIDPQNISKTEVKIADLKDLTHKIIKSVRTATFNLMPPELSDHGIIPALSKLTEELTKLTGKSIFLYDKTNFKERLDSLIEINLYRITQEAVNNAIKYADSSQIVVSISHSDQFISISVDDNGKGFDPETIKPGGNESGGMGLAYMRERVQYIGGRIFINSKPGKGTRVTINVPLHT